MDTQGEYHVKTDILLKAGWIRGESGKLPLCLSGGKLEATEERRVS